MKENMVLIISCPETWGKKGVMCENHALRILQRTCADYSLKTIIIDCNLLGIDDRRLYNDIIENNPDLVAFSIHLGNAKSTFDFIRKINGKFKIILGGGYINNTSGAELHKLSEYGYYVVLGENAKIFAEICRNLVSDMSIEGSVIDLDRKPFILEEDIGERIYMQQVLLGGGECEILGSKGCMKKCAECNVGKYYLSNSSDEYIRVKSSKSIIREIDYLTDRYNIRKISVIDTHFFCDKEREKVMEYISDKKIDVKVAINICQSLISDEELKFIDKYKKYIYKISIQVDFSKEDCFEIIDKIIHCGLKTKLYFNIYNRNIDLQRYYEIIEYFSKRPEYVNAFCFIKKDRSIDNLEATILRIIKVMKFIYYNIVSDLYQKIIDYENKYKLDFRIGNRKDYEELIPIDNRVREFSIEVNKAFLLMYKQCIELCKNYESENLIALKLLNLNKQSISEIKKKISE